MLINDLHLIAEQRLPLFVRANASVKEVVVAARVSTIRIARVRLRARVPSSGNRLRAELREHQRARSAAHHQVPVIPCRVVAQVGGEERLDERELTCPQRVRLHRPLPTRIEWTMCIQSQRSTSFEVQYTLHRILDAQSKAHILQSSEARRLQRK